MQKQSENINTNAYLSTLTIHVISSSSSSLLSAMNSIEVKRKFRLSLTKSFDLPTLETIYFKGILPSTTYCISLWGSSSSLQALEESHIRAARLIHNLSPSLPKHEILSKVKWHSLSYFYKKDWRVLPTKLILI